MEKHPVTFIGAGPGAPDLITLRGARLLSEADTVIYAGSLVNEEVLALATRAEYFNSALLNLDEVIKIMQTSYHAGKRVVRLHTGDPAMYGAVSEQFIELDKQQIPYQVVPGVSSVFAAAAALKCELTMPEVSQSVILTRAPGRTPVPENEAFGKLAALGTTMAVFLSVADMPGLCLELLNSGRSPETPVAVVYRASWDNEEIIRGTIADIAEKVAACNIKRQAMIIIGQVLQRDGALSKLYDREFATGYRTLDKYKGKVAVVALTRRGGYKAAEIAAGLLEAECFVPEKFASTLPELRRNTFKEGEFGSLIVRLWSEYPAVVLVMATGIAVRYLAPLVLDKHTDPAIVSCDEAGNYAISLLSGHIGQANKLAQEVAAITGGKAVITTSSEVSNHPALDLFAMEYRYKIQNPEMLTRMAAGIVNDETFTIEMPTALFEKEFARYPQFRLKADRQDGLVIFRNASGAELYLKAQRFVLGIGCRKGVTVERLMLVINQFSEARHIPLERIKLLASVEQKAAEPGLKLLSEIQKWPRQFFSSEVLAQIPVPNPSETPLKVVGTPSVAEAAALAGAGENAVLVVEKMKFDDVTVALALIGSDE